MIRDKELRFGSLVTHAASVTTDEFVFHKGMGAQKPIHVMVSVAEGTDVAGDFAVQTSADGASWTTLFTVPVAATAAGNIAFKQALPESTLDRVRIVVSSGTGAGKWDAELIWD